MKYMNMATTMNHKFSELAHFNHLKEAGINEKQAKAILNLVNDSQDHQMYELATKDFVNLRIADVEKKVSGLEITI